MTRNSREAILTRLVEDLVGPYDENESLDARPSDVYLTGILWPRDTRMGAEDDEKLEIEGVSGNDSGSGESGGAGLQISGMKRPSTAGISFAVAPGTTSKLAVTVQFATYEPSSPPENTSENEPRRTRPGSVTWKRSPYTINTFEVVVSDRLQNPIELSEYGAPIGVKVYVRSANWSENRLVTLTLLNDIVPDESEGKNGRERSTLFQVRMEVRPTGGTRLIARPSRRSVLDEDDRIAALLYRDKKEFAVGHTCSAGWVEADYSTASSIFTTWVPTALVSALSPLGHDLFATLRREEGSKPLSAEWLASAVDNSRLGSALAEIPQVYGEWIELQENRVSSLPPSLQEQARRNLSECRAVQRRMREGSERISSDPVMADAFRLANKAMLLQYGWDREKSSQGPLIWRPFQLGFILLAASSAADRSHPDRNIMDLLWFPTGGGKTEAYLALVAFLAFYRRLSDPATPDGGNGVVAIMRYTLRLLTTQQFVRASALILACEAIRRGRVTSPIPQSRFGRTPFSIGLWVGGDATPNKFEEARDALAGSPDKPSPIQLAYCPACRSTLLWSVNDARRSIQAKCDNRECLLFDPGLPLPVFTMDEDVYRGQPTLLIGTVDKFAQIVRRKEVNALLGINQDRQPDLIIQDELHLISGPLGTVVGLYEVALDRLLSSAGTPPKIIGSTATIRRASEQIRALFSRTTCQFPPPCIDSEDSGFAVVDYSAPGRLYVGATTAGRSAKFTLQWIAASLLQSAYGAFTDDARRDPYWSLVSYFNSLRELGGALVLMQDDVNDTIDIFASRRREERRIPKLVEELTSRRTQIEVREMLDRLAARAGTEGALDVILATNMLSVGVDIPRLGLMLVNGQPKGIAEYIQATSRVGRGDVPGLVVSVLNNAKARDRSHYESFITWHSTLYRDVESTSVTPFASRSRDRALHAVLVALVRHLVPGMLDRPALDRNSIAAARELIRFVESRAASVDPEETAVGRELEERLDTWERRMPAQYWNRRQPNKSLLQDAERAATLRALGRMAGDSWPTLNNMRSVETSCRFRMREKLRIADPVGGGPDGQ